MRPSIALIAFTLVPSIYAGSTTIAISTTPAAPSTTRAISTTPAAPSTTRAISTTPAAPSTTPAAPSTTPVAPSTTPAAPSTTRAISTTPAAPSTTRAISTTPSVTPSTTARCTTTSAVDSVCTRFPYVELLPLSRLPEAVHFCEKNYPVPCTQATRDGRVAQRTAIPEPIAGYQSNQLANLKAVQGKYAKTACSCIIKPTACNVRR